MSELYADQKTVAGKVVKTKRHSVNAYRLLIKPLISEKSANEGHMGKYYFAVAMNANKIEIAKAIEALYGIKPTKVNMIKMEGKMKSRGRISGKRKDWKKAIVSLPKNKTIDVYAGV